jgi:S-DNA-T family DNA segregation ATPase FtsK/SpoIIIE
MAASKKKVDTSPIFPGQPFIEEIGVWLHPYQREIIGGIMFLFAVITLLSLLGLTKGSLSDWWASLFHQLFGWGAIPAAVLVGILGGGLGLSRFWPLSAREMEGSETNLAEKKKNSLPLDVVIGLELLLVVGLTVVHLLATPEAEQALRLAWEGGGGGFVGWGISQFLVDLIGLTATSLVLLMVGLVALSLTFRLGLADAASWAERLNEWSRRRLDDMQPGEAEADQVAEEPSPAPAKKQKKKQASGSEARPLAPPSLTAEAAVAALPASKRSLPPLDLLSPPAKDPARTANARYHAQIIEETLYGFGIPTEVVEINQGPTVTQFGLKPGTLERKLPDGNTVQQRVRVNKIVALANDLALALAAAPIRIEAPVPGRPLVGIEVPNTEKTLVSLRAVIDDSSFKKGKGALRVALGKDVSGQAVSASLAAMPHLLIAGATGSGKSVCINALISTLLFTHAPEQLRFLMIDPKMVELTNFNGIPHLIAPVVTDFDHVVGSLAWVTREMDRRYKLFAAAGARSIGSYNRKIGPRGERLPFLVVVIDELADLMMMAPDEVERYICRIAQMARATGIHLVIATQRPSVDVVTGLIKANFPTRIAFAVTSQIDSRVILDTPGAERLLGRGDMLYMAPDSPKLARLQGCFVSDAEIQNLVNFWKASQAMTAEPDAGTGEVADDELPWAGIMAEADKDDLLEEAVKLVVDSGRASTSMLQRRLGIGYPRASRLMDQLEEEGVIGPADGSRPREVLWQEDRDEADYDKFEEDVRG